MQLVEQAPLWGRFGYSDLKKSGFDQVHVVSTASEPNLAKTPFELSRWRGGRYACDTLDIMGCRKVVNRLSPLFTNSLSINLLQAKVN